MEVILQSGHPLPGRLPRACRMLIALTAGAFFLPAVLAQGVNACDLDKNGSVTSSDVALAINMAIGATPCTASIEGPTTCTVITVQRVFLASSGQPCSVYNAHAATLNWTASTTPNVTYNVYRATTAAGPFTTPLNSSPITATTFTDTAVSAGQTYYYVARAVAANGTESDNSGPPVQATIPSP